MTKVLVIGSGGRIAPLVIDLLDAESTVEQTVLGSDGRESGHSPARARVVDGDAGDRDALDGAMREQEMVVLDLTAGSRAEHARAVVDSMLVAGVRRLVVIATLGVHDEVPGAFGEWVEQQLGDELEEYTTAVETVEKSKLDSTILRPAWLTDGEDELYELTGKGDDFRGTEVSRRSVASLVRDIVRHPTLHSGASLGVSKPGTDGDRPPSA